MGQEGPARRIDRATWLRERRLWNEVQMDTIYARQYDERLGAHINESHRATLARFLDALPAQPDILDAACGTGKYWSLLLARGCLVTGTDQSARMLARAYEKHPGVPVHHLGLQELAYHDAFDGVMCMDAMENAFPEDWPLLLGHFARALHPQGGLYITVEVESEEELRIAYEAGQLLGLPLVYGEYAYHGGYHYYPTDEQTRAWLDGSGFTLTETADGHGYLHYLARRASS